jgi:two-component sensor histidine kinase
VRLNHHRLSTPPVPPLGLIALLAILGGFIIAGPLLLRTVERTRSDVTELWVSFVRVRTAAAGSAGRVELLRQLEREHADIRRNPFFRSIQHREPRVGLWLEQIDGGIEALRTLRTTGLHEADTAFEELAAFMEDHSRRQYRALQTVIWSALVLLIGIAGILAHLYLQNQRLASSLSAAVDAKSQLMRETHHRVKNNLALVSSLVSIKEASLGGTVDLSDLRHRISAVEHVHDLLSRTDSGLAVSMRRYLTDLLESVKGSVSRADIEYRISVADIELPAKKAVALGIIVNETITNAVKHGFAVAERKVIEVSLEEPACGRARLTVSNSGRGLPPDFDPCDTSTVGLQLISGLVEQLSGALEVRNEPETAFVVEFPC